MLTGIDEIVLSLTAKGLTTGEIAAHIQDIYGATVSKGTISRITAVWDRAIVQTCVIPLLCSTFRYASRKFWDQIANESRPVYTAPTEAAAKERFVEFTAHWGAQHPAITRLWENAWSEFVPFLDYDVESDASSAKRTPSLSLNARYQCAIRARGHSRPSWPR